MTPTAPQLPDNIKITCWADTKPTSNILVLLTLVMSDRNDYTVISHLSRATGDINISKADLLDEVKLAQELFPADYLGLGAFTCQIIIGPMDRREIEAALQSYDTYNSFTQYRADYRKDLETAWETLYKLAPKRLSTEVVLTPPQGFFVSSVEKVNP